MTMGQLEPVDFDPFATGAVTAVCTTTEAQREIWAADRLGAESSLAYNESTLLTLKGPLDVQRLQAALQAVVWRHDALRATIGPDGTEMLIGEPMPVDLPVVDVAGLPPDVRRQRLADACAASVERAFDLTRGPLFHGTLHRLGADHHALLLAAHHIVCDGWSWGVILNDLAHVYAHGPASEAGPAQSFVRYAEWKAAEESRPQSAEHAAFWRARYGSSDPPVLDLPIDHRRPAVRSLGSRRVDVHLDPALVQGVRELALRNQASLFSTLLAGYTALLHRLTGQDDIVVGVPTAGQSSSDMPRVVGHCVDLLPMRFAIDPAGSFAHHIRHTSTTVLDALEHQSITYGSLLKLLPIRRDPSRAPLVSVSFNLDSAFDAGDALFGALHAEVAAVPRHADSFELSLNATPLANGALELQLHYSTALFEPSTIVRWMDSFDALLRGALRDAQQPMQRIDCLPALQRTALAALQPPRTPLGERVCVHDLIQAQCLRTPDHPALRFGADTLTYGALDARSNQLARWLRQRGIARGLRVGLCMSRGIDMMVALIGVMKTGAAYVPLDPSTPQKRLDSQASDAGLSLILTTPASHGGAQLTWDAPLQPKVVAYDAGALLSTASTDPLPPSPQDAAPDDVAYVIYTSGSTGKPKGVRVSHSAAVNFFRSAAISPGISHADVIPAVTTLSFDIALIELVLPLTVGATVVILERDVVKDSQQLAEAIAAAGATMLSATPSLWHSLRDADWNGPPGFRAIAGAESLPVELATWLLSRTGQLWNMYGPTEATVYSTVWPVDPAILASDGMSIGRPIANTDIWILDDALQLCPLGVFGEICIGGDGVSLGYLGRPDLDLERFVLFDSPSGAVRVYRTGDRGRWTSNGLLEHGGRFDAQIKVRGYRIEPGDIESCCNALPCVTGSVAVAWQAAEADTRLVVYVAVPPDTPGDAFSVPILQQALRDALPDYMLPQHVVRLDSIPRLPNGKIDRQSLPPPNAQADSGGAKQARVAPRTDTEHAVLACMEQVLALPGLGLRDDFFALGGHSLLAARLVTQLNRRFDLQLRLPTVFESPSAERLALAVDSALRLGLRQRDPIPVEPHRRRARLAPMQERVRFVQEMHPERVLYNSPSAHRLTGPLNLDCFQRTLKEIIRRQSSLRTYVAYDTELGAHVQRVADDIAEPMSFIDMTDVEESRRDAELAARMQVVVDTPMDIHAAPLFRAVLYRMSEQQHVFLFMPHHLIWDGWCFDLLQEEFDAIYRALCAGEPHSLPPLALSYGDYAEWYLRWTLGEDCATQLRYWVSRFTTSPAIVAPRTDRPRQMGMSGTGGIEWVTIDAALHQPWRQLARRHDVTVNMLGFALYATMLSSVIGTSSVVVAVPVRGRLSAELEPVMGFFNNLLAIQLTVDAAQPLSAFLRIVKAQLLEVMKYQDVPFEMVAAHPVVAKRAKGVGLYHGLFSFQDVSDRMLSWGDLQHASIALFQSGATDDLGLWLMDSGDGLRGGLIYNADIYEASTARALRERFLELVQRAGTLPDPTLGQLIDPQHSVYADALRHLAHDHVTDAGNDLAEVAAVANTTPSPAAHQDASAPPWTDDELALGRIWAALLGTDVASLRPSDNFFDVGGDSLLAMRAVEQSMSTLAIRVDARRYVYETLAQLASRSAAVSLPPAQPRLRSLRKVFSAWRKSGS